MVLRLQAEELASAVKEKLEPALAAAEAEAKAAMDAAAREQAGHAEVELRAVNAAKSLNVELEAERGKVRDFEEKMRGLEKVRYFLCYCFFCCSRVGDGRERVPHPCRSYVFTLWGS